MSGRIQRQDKIDHGEAGPDKEGVAALGSKCLNRAACLDAPRIGDEAITRSLEGGKNVRLLISNRERNSFGFDRRTIIEKNAPFAVRPISTNGGMVDEIDATARYGFIEDVAKVAAEQAALGEAFSMSSFSFEPLCEMLWLLGPSTHRICRHV